MNNGPRLPAIRELARQGRYPVEPNIWIRNFIVEEVLAGDHTIAFSDDDSFLECGIIDSTGVLELIAFVEEQFKIDVKDEELIPENFDSVAKLSHYVVAKLAGTARSAGDSPPVPSSAPTR
jgi:acyl carrier protein